MGEDYDNGIMASGDSTVLDSENGSIDTAESCDVGLGQLRTSRSCYVQPMRRARKSLKFYITPEEAEYHDISHGDDVSVDIYEHSAVYASKVSSGDADLGRYLKRMSRKAVDRGVGESIEINIPKMVYNLLGLSEGDQIRVETYERGIRVSPYTP